MYKFPKIRTMLPRANLQPAAMPKPMASPLAPKAPSLQGAFPAPHVGTIHTTTPSMMATENKAVPIELGDPERLAKIATILRMGRK